MQEQITLVMLFQSWFNPGKICKDVSTSDGKIIVIFNSCMMVEHRQYLQ